MKIENYDTGKQFPEPQRGTPVKCRNGLKLTSHCDACGEYTVVTQYIRMMTEVPQDVQHCIDCEVSK